MADSNPETGLCLLGSGQALPGARLRLNGPARYRQSGKSIRVVTACGHVYVRSCVALFASSKDGSGAVGHEPGKRSHFMAIVVG